MITNKQLEYLDKIDWNSLPKSFRLYYDRIQEQIDKNMENALVLAKKYPRIFLNEMDVSDRPRHERLQKLLLLIKILRPDCEVSLEYF